MPAIDRRRCEGKGACVAVCPHDVFALHVLPPAQREGLGLRGRLKGMAHGWQQTRVARPDACEACGACIAACPERAITLHRKPAPAVQGSRAVA
jgi:NAD-dependent dihydropyrimidine dehydrogenase PreA subunit